MKFQSFKVIHFIGNVVNSSMTYFKKLELVLVFKTGVKVWIHEHECAPLVSPKCKSHWFVPFYHSFNSPSLISLQTILAFYFYFSLCCLLFFLKCCSCPNRLGNCYFSLKIQHKHHLSVKLNFLITHLVLPLLYKRFSQNHVRIVSMPYYSLKAEIQSSTNLEGYHLQVFVE